MSDMTARLRLETENAGPAAAGVRQLEAAVEDLGAAGPAAAAGLNQAGSAAEGLRQDAAAAAPAVDQLGDTARATASDFASMYDAAQRDFVGQYTAQLRAASSAQDKAGTSAKVAANDFATLYDAAQLDFAGQYARGVNAFATGADKATVSSRKLTLAGLDLSRQFADVAVTGAMGMNPFMILVQQGPQIVDRLALMKMEGVGLKDVLLGMTRAAGPILPLVAAVGVAAGAAFGVAGLAARALNKDNKDLVGGLGLTEKQLERLKAKGVDTGVTIGDVFKGTFNYLRDAVAPILAPIGKFFDDLFDRITSGAVSTAKVIIGTYVGSFEAVKATWSQLPGAMSDLTIRAANFVISSVEAMVNKSIGGLNKLIDLANAGAAKVGLATRLGSMAEVDFGRIVNWDEGKAAKAGETAGAAFGKGFAKGGNAVQGVLDGLGRSVLKATTDRLRKAAGPAERGRTARDPAAPRDQTDERTAQLDAALAQAMQEELQARLALATEARDRAAIEKQLLAAQLAEKQAQVQRQIAAIADDKGLSAAKKEELTEQLKILQAMNGRTASIREQAINDNLSAQVSREAVDRQEAAIADQIGILGAQADLKKSAYARALLETKILKAQQQIERLKLEEVIQSATSTENEKAIAQARLNVLSQIHQLELAQAGEQTRLIDAVSEAVDGVHDFSNAFRRHDWARAFDSLIATIQTIKASFAANGLTGGLMTAGSAAATLIGGKTGRAIGGGLGIASLGLSAGSSLMGAASMGMLGSGALAGGAMALAPLLGPIGLAAGALYAAAKIFNLGGKPTNAGAGVNLVTGEISGNKRTAETENAARAAGDSIKSIQELFASTGITLATVVNGLVVGTRDQSQIYLSNGKTLTSAVGSVQAAVDAATRGILEGATYQSEAQKKLIEGMVAAGKGFEDISAALEAYAGAQKLTSGIDDAILQLTDPKAFAIEELKRSQKEQRDGLKAAADAGYLTAAQFEAASAKLDRLEGLQLADTLKRFGDAVGDATTALDLQRSVSDRVLELTNPDAFKVKRVNDDIEARRAEALPLIEAGLLPPEFLAQLEALRGLELDALFGNLAGQVNDTAKAFQDARPKLLSWLDQQKVGSAGGLSPKAALAEAQKQFDQQLALARSGDANALSNITAYADRLFSADQAATSSATARQNRFNDITGQIQGLAGMGGSPQASPAAAIAALNVPLATIAQASAAQLAAITAAGGQPVAVANLPSMQTMYGQVMTTQTDRLVAANDRNAQEIVASVKASAEALQATLAQLGANLDGALGFAADAAAQQAAQIAEGLRGIEAETRLAQAERRGRAA